MKGTCLQLGGKYLDTKMERARACVFRLEENRDPLFPIRLFSKHGSNSIEGLVFLGRSV